MRLLRCHIDNYGKISNLDIDFSDNLNELCYENGWGKSTLASFIKVMFFGFSNPRVRDDIQNERKHYTPWQGGVYGGHITFIANGKEYVLYRQFGTKEKDDKFELKDLSTNLDSKDYTSKIGQELFKIDMESFLRTIYISQNDCTTTTTGSINAKIGNLTDNTDDINNFESVIKKLSEILNNMSPTRNTGSIAKIKNKITELTTEVKNYMLVEDSIAQNKKLRDEKLSELESLRKQIAHIDKLRKEYEETNKAKEMLKQNDKITAEYNERKKLYDDVCSNFKGEIPDDEIISKVIDVNSKLENLSSIKEVYYMDEIENDRYNRLYDNFSSGMPTDEEIDDVRKLCNLLTENRIKAAENKLTNAEDAQLLRLDKAFNNNLPLEKEIDDNINLWIRKNEKKSKIASKITAKKTYEDMATDLINKESQNGTTKLPLIAGCVLAVVAIVMCFVNAIVAIPFFLCGFGCFVYQFMLNTGNGLSKSKSKQLELISKIADIEKEIAAENENVLNDENIVISFFKKYHIAYSESNVVNDLYNLKNDVNLYKSLKQKKSLAGQVNSTFNYDECVDSIKAFILKYSKYSEYDISVDNFDKRVREIDNDQKELTRLIDKKEKFADACKKYERFEEIIHEFFREMKIDLPENISHELLNIKKLVSKYDIYKVEFDKISAIRDEFLKNNNLEEAYLLSIKDISGYDESVSTEELSSKCEVLLNSINEYDNNLKELRERLDVLNEKQNELDVLNVTYKSDRKKYKNLKLAKELLEEAKSSLTSKYMGPVISAFKKYYSMITSDNGDEYMIDANTDIYVKEQGMQRNTNYLSTGKKDLVGICMRMALIDAMYEDEKPFVIFDDPFVNLDNDKVLGGIDFMKKISKDYQVIYFTCHESRV